MKLKQFDKKKMSAPGGARSPAITISGHSGIIRINRAAAALLGLSNGSKVTFARDEDTRDWYLITGGFDKDIEPWTLIQDKQGAGPKTVNRHIAREIIRDRLTRGETEMVKIKDSIILERTYMTYRFVLCTQPAIDKSENVLRHTFAIIGGEATKKLKS